MSKKKLKILVILIITFMLSYTIYIFSLNQNQLVIGSKNYTENEILGYIIADTVEDNTDYEVKVLAGIGQNAFLNAALTRGDIDMYPDYTGTAFGSILGHDYDGETSKQMYDTIQKEYKEQFNQEWISRFGFENTYAIACGQYCIDNDIYTISDLAKHKDFSMAGDSDSFTRSDCVPLLTKRYGLTISKGNEVKLDHSLVYSALDNGNVDTAMVFSTDGQLSKGNYRLLKDDKQAFPFFEAGVVINDNIKQSFPKAIPVLKQLEHSISLKDMQEMNYQVEVGGNKPIDVAKQFSQTLDIK